MVDVIGIIVALGIVFFAGWYIGRNWNKKDSNKPSVGAGGNTGGNKPNSTR